MGEEAAAALVSGSAAAIPELLPALVKERDEAARARIDSVLQQMTTAAHTRVLALEFDHKQGRVRTWCLRRASQFPDAGVRAPASAALEAVRKRVSNKTAKKGDDREELYAAALCVTSSGSLDGLDVMREWALEAWVQRGAEMRIALEAVRGPEAAAMACELLSDDLAADRLKIVAGLRMLAGCGDEETTERLLPYLDAEDNQIRVAAINAARGIVDGDDPMEELSVFKAIEVAKMWKRRIGS